MNKKKNRRTRFELFNENRPSRPFWAKDGGPSVITLAVRFGVSFCCVERSVRPL